MRLLHHASKTFNSDLAAFCRGSVASREITDSVAAILADVRERGDEAVTYYAAKFDGAKLRARIAREANRFGSGREASAARRAARSGGGA